MMQFLKGFLSTAILTVTLTGSSTLAAATGEPIRIGFNGEPGNGIVVRTAKYVLTERLGYEVKTVQASNGLQWQGVAQGDLDALLMAWLPTTQAAYWKKFKDDVVDLGVLFKGKIGWVIPDYIPKDELSAISDLQSSAVREKLNSEIVGIAPGAGLMDRSKKALKTYNLDEYNLRSSSVAAMVAALERAHANDEWVVVTGWSPLHIFAKWDLRYLEDPKNVFGVTQKIHAMGGQGLRKDAPRAATFFSNYKIPGPVLEEALLQYEDNNDLHATATKLIQSNPELVSQWVTKAKERPRYSD